MTLEWNDDDPGGYPYFAIGENALCDSVPGCVSESENFELSLDQFYYSFPVYAPQDCDQNGYSKVSLPYQFRISQAYPNPFNPTTKISYDLPEASVVSLSIYDLMGREIRTMINSEQTAGFKNIQWNATDNLGKSVPAGMYIYIIQAGEFRQTRKMVLLK